MGPFGATKPSAASAAHWCATLTLSTALPLVHDGVRKYFILEMAPQESVGLLKKS